MLKDGRRMSFEEVVLYIIECLNISEVGKQWGRLSS